MRTSSLFRAGSAALFLIAVGAGALADGTGRIMTPYSIHEPVTEALVKQKMQLAGRSRSATADDVFLTSGVRFMYLPDKGHSPALYYLSGKTEKGKVQKVDLSLLASIIVVKQDPAGHRAVCDVQIFPAITPAALIKSQPTFSILEQKYRTTVRLSLDVGPGKSGKLYLTDGTTKVDMSALKPAAKIQFTGGRDALWWSIPSVTDDPRYPYHNKTGA